MNEVTLHGHVGKDPELKMTNGGTQLCRFSFATTETWTDKEKGKQTKTEWHNIVVWGKQAEIVEKYVKKGKELIIKGKIEYSSVEDKETNKKTTYTNIKMASFEFCGKNENSSGGNSETSNQTSNNATSTNTTNDGNNGYDDDIPF